MIRSIFAGTRVEAFKELEKKSTVVKIISTKNSKLTAHINKKKKYSNKIKIINNKNKVECFKIIKQYEVELFLSAGFPFIIPAKYLDKKKIMINSHPSFLPNHKGYNPIKDSFNKDEIFYGSTLHFIEKKVDSGKIIFQKRVNLKSKKLKEIYDILFSKIEPKVITLGLKKLRI